MLFELIIVLEMIAFLFMALGIWPSAKSVDLEGREGKTPLFNKVIFIFVGGIIFWSLALLTNSYDYNYCYVNETTSDFSLNMTTNNATCSSYEIQSPELSYLNFGMGAISILLFIIIIAIASMSRYDHIDE
jgi:hypothetical protein